LKFIREEWSFEELDAEMARTQFSSGSD
jgi:hypothetical protein